MPPVSSTHTGHTQTHYITPWGCIHCVHIACTVKSRGCTGMGQVLHFHVWGGGISCKWECYRQACENLQNLWKLFPSRKRSAFYSAFSGKFSNLGISKLQEVPFFFSRVEPQWSTVTSRSGRSSWRSWTCSHRCVTASRSSCSTRTRWVTSASRPTSLNYLRSWTPGATYRR